jgi:hypothetical protein
MHISLTPRVKTILVVLVICAFVVQAYRVFLETYPIMTGGAFGGSNYALDFGSYYNSAWRLTHNLTQLYTNAPARGDYPLAALPTDFKYLPFFSFFMLPMLRLDYTSAFVTWNAFQFLLMPIIGLLLYRALRDFNVIGIVGVIWIALLQPIPFPPHYALSTYGLYHSQSYYWQWAEGQAKVFETFLLAAAYYLSKGKKPYIAGLAYGLAFFDPRFPVYAIPLFLMVNRGQYRKFLVPVVGVLVAGDAILLYDGLAGSFLTMVQTIGLGTTFYQYTWIPLYTIAAVTTLEGAKLLLTLIRRRPISPTSAGGAPVSPAAPLISSA